MVATVYPQMNRTVWIKARVSPEEYEQLRAYATANGWNMSQVVRSWIRQLPALEHPKIPDQTTNQKFPTR